MALTEFLTNIANAIRGKKGTTALINAQDFATEITNLPSGGGESKLPQVVDRTVTEITASDLAGVTKIGNYAFGGCTALVSVTIPNGVTLIGIQALYYCSSLTSIEIPDSVTEIKNKAFTYCRSLESIKFNGAIPTAGGSVFDSCDNLTKIYIPSVLDWCNTDVTNMLSSHNPNKELYVNNSLLTDITASDFGNLTTTKSARTFQRFTSIVTVEFPDTFVTIKTSLFNGASGLQTVIFGTSTATIEGTAFYNCTSMRLYDFRKATQIPKLLYTNTFSNIPSTCKIVVPDSLYDDWIVATNWSTFASQIVKASEYTE